jgi:hypothetical protein
MVTPIMFCGGNSLLTVLRGFSVIAPVARDLIYTSADGRIVMINLSSTTGSVEIYSGSCKTTWIRISIDVMFVAYQLNTGAVVFSDFIVRLRCLADSR